MKDSRGFWFCVLIANLWAMSSSEYADKGVAIYGACAGLIFLMEIWREMKKELAK